MTPDWKHPMTKDVYQAGLNDGRKSLEAEIARLRSDLAMEKINNKRLQSERNNAEIEIARLMAALEESLSSPRKEGK